MLVRQSQHEHAPSATYGPTSSAPFFILGTMVAPSNAQDLPGPRDTVDTLHGALLDTMKEGRDLSYQGRRDRLAPVLRQAFDLPYLSKLVTGRYWRSLDATQRETMRKVFEDLTIATYASRFREYKGERFKYASEKPLKRGRVLVRTELIKSDGGIVRLDYVVSPRDSQWRIVNVLADGVSDLALKRADYASVISRQGFEQLLTKLNEQIDQYASE